MVFKVDEQIPQEMELIQTSEGLGNRTATLSYLIKYYFLTQKSSIENSVHMLNASLDTLDVNTLPSAEDQLSDI